MNRNTKIQIKESLLDYLKKTIPDFQKKGKMFNCPFRDNHEKDDELSANIFPENSNKIKCFDPKCNRKGDIFDVCRYLEFDDNPDISDDDIASYLVKDMNITTDDYVDDLFKRFESYNWNMVPVAKGDKASNIEKEWQLKNHKDKCEWFDWIESKLNIGVQTGKKSGIIIVDIDAMPKKLKDKVYSGKADKEEKEYAIKVRDENIQKVYNALKISDKDTLTQYTFGGVHLIFKYDEDIPKCNLEIEDVHIDFQTDGGQCVVEPSIVKKQKRQFNNNDIIALPENIKTLILEQKGKKKEEVVENINFDDSELSFENLNGNCNNTFMQLGGVLRKSMTPKQTQTALTMFNKLLDTPMPAKDIKNMCTQLEKHYVNDNEALKNNVYEFLKRHDEASVRDLKDCLDSTLKDVKEVLADLIQEEKIYKQRSMYRPINKAEWKTEFVEESKVLPYTVPFFNTVATFRRGDMICLGAKTGIGKTSISMNIIKKFLKNRNLPEGGIRYISSENGSRFASTAMSLGLKEGEFYFTHNYYPEKIEFEDNAITIVDWLLPEFFNETSNLYKLFARQLDKHGGLAIIMSQLKDNGDFYAEGMIKMFASLAVKYFYGTSNGTVDNENTYFQTEKIREGKTAQQYLKIKTKYNFETKLLELA